MKKYVKIILPLIVLSSNLAFGEALLSSLEDVKSKLESENIKVDLTEARAICDPNFKDAREGFASAEETDKYYRCIYDQAKGYVVFDNDEKMCMKQATDELPDELMTKPRGSQYKPEEILADPTKAMGSMDPYTQEELDRERRKVKRTCMKELGWRNPDDWKAGKR
jgi:hypothetical protein